MVFGGAHLSGSPPMRREILSQSMCPKKKGCVITSSRPAEPHPRRREGSAVKRPLQKLLKSGGNASSGRYGGSPANVATLSSLVFPPSMLQVVGASYVIRLIGTVVSVDSEAGHCHRTYYVPKWPTASNKSVCKAAIRPQISSTVVRSGLSIQSRGH